MFKRVPKEENKNAMAQYEFDQRKKMVLDLLKNKSMTSTE